MHTLISTRALSVLCLLSLLAACGEGPVKVDSEAGAVPAAEESARFEGVVLLTGDLATSGTGSVLLSARHPGGGTLLVKRIDLGSSSFTLEDGEGILPFTLDQQEDMMVPQPMSGPAFEIKAMFSPSGMVEDKQAEAIVLAKRGQTDVRLVLEPGRLLSPPVDVGAASRPVNPPPTSQPTSRPAR